MNLGENHSNKMYFMSILCMTMYMYYVLCSLVNRDSADWSVVPKVIAVFTAIEHIPWYYSFCILVHVFCWGTVGDLQAASAVAPLVRQSYTQIVVTPMIFHRKTLHGAKFWGA